MTLTCHISPYDWSCHNGPQQSALCRVSIIVLSASIDYMLDFFLYTLWMSDLEKNLRFECQNSESSFSIWYLPIITFGSYTYYLPIYYFVLCSSAYLFCSHITKKVLYSISRLLLLWLNYQIILTKFHISAGIDHLLFERGPRSLFNRPAFEPLHYLGSSDDIHTNSESRNRHL